MPEINCECGGTLLVELWDAGVSKTCQKCGASVRVPPLDVLKRLSGDKHPHLNSLQKLVRACELREEPFHGVCHGCNNSEANMEVPIELSIMTVRHIDDESPITVTPFSVGVTIPGSMEQWYTYVFPLQLCHRCHDSFVSSFRRRTVVRWALGGLFALAALIGFLIAIPFGIFGIAFLLFVLARASQRRKPRDMRFDKWLVKIPLVQDVLSQESEYRLSKGKARELA